jgi:hypothetical protein
MFSFIFKKLWKNLTDDERDVHYIVYQVKNGVPLDDVIKNLGYRRNK